VAGDKVYKLKDANGNIFSSLSVYGRAYGNAIKIQNVNKENNPFITYDRDLAYKVARLIGYEVKEI